MAQLMGSVPVVHFVGGLVKVQDGVTGYGYSPHTSEALAETLCRAKKAASARARVASWATCFTPFSQNSALEGCAGSGHEKFLQFPEGSHSNLIRAGFKKPEKMTDI